MKITKEKLATWSFPLTVLLVLLGYGGYVGISSLQDYFRNKPTTIKTEAYSIRFPCKPKDNICAIGDINSNAVKYSFRTSIKDQATVYEPDTCKRNSTIVAATPNEDVLYDRTYNEQKFNICIHKSHTQNGINNGYRSVSASTETASSIYYFEVNGPAATHDIYSDKMENWLNTFKLATKP